MAENRFAKYVQQAPQAPAQNRFAKYAKPADPGDTGDRLSPKSNRELSWADTGKDVVQSLGSGLVRGATGLVGLPGDIGRLAITGMGKLHGDDPAEIARLTQNFPIPGSADVTGSVERNITGPLHESRSTAGDFAETIGEFAPNVIGGGAGLVRKGAMVALPAVASETAGQLTKGTDAEPYARIAAGVTGGLAAAGRSPNSIKQIAKDAPTQEQVKATTSALYKKLRDAGIKYDSNAYDNMTLDLVGKLSKDGFRAKQAPLSADVLEFIAEHRGKSLEYSDFESIRKVASKILREQSASATDKAAAGVILDQLDNFAGKAAFVHNGTAGNAPALMKEARDFARRNIIAKQIDDMMSKAETYQSGYESGLRNQFANYLRSSKSKGLSQTERQAFMDVAKGNFTSNALGTFGKLGVDFGKLGNRAALLPAAGAAAGYAADSVLTGGATVAAATGAKYAARKMTRSATDRAKSTVLAGRDAQKAAQKQLKQKAFDVRFNRLKAVDNARKASNGQQVAFTDAKGNQYGYDGKRLSVSP